MWIFLRVISPIFFIVFQHLDNPKFQRKVGYSIKYICFSLKYVHCCCSIYGNMKLSSVNRLSVQW